MSKKSFARQVLEALAGIPQQPYLESERPKETYEFGSKELKTGISSVNWLKPGKKFKIERAKIALGAKEASEVSWFDELFDGGIKIPNVPGNTLSFLIKGAPGTGKTTLALELCYRLSISNNMTALYVSTDADSQAIINNVHSLGWNENCFRNLSPILTEERGVVYVLGREQVDSTKEKGKHQNGVSLFSNIVEKLYGSLRKFFSSGIRRDFQFRLPAVNILVFDNLNVVNEDEQQEYFEKILKLASGNTQLAVFVLDSKFINHFSLWEYACDTIIQLDTFLNSGYLIRGIEIIKARYQSHVWGRHQLKLYPALSDHQKGRPNHPYRKEGGVFIYPSIHWFLSRYKKIVRDTVTAQVPTPLPNLNKILGGGNLEGGLPKGRCTALLGSRGAHKSHLGYYHILHRLGQDNSKNCERGLIISLRDDEALAKAAMISLLATSESPNTEDLLNASNKLQEYIESGVLEILFFPPGYITAEEFYNKILLSLMRLKMSSDDPSHTNVTVLFNSLDQLSARFPLCASEAMFVPGIIDTFNAESVTSIFIAVDEPGQPANQYGLLTMADLIISLRQQIFNADDYFGHLESMAGKTVDQTLKQSFGDEIKTVLLTVERFAGGQRAGDSGILELIKSEKLEILYRSLFEDASGLVVIPLSPNFGMGIPLKELK